MIRATMLLALVALALASILVGVGDLGGAQAQNILLTSRIPRTITVMLTGTSLAIAGVLMQMLARNRFVEPSTTGTTESAMLGLFIVTVFFPGFSMMSKMLVASVFALAGTFIFITLIHRLPLRSPVMVPLVGIMFGGIVGSGVMFFAYRLDLVQSLGIWMNGDFSAVLKGRYELIWLVAVLCGLAYWLADRFTVVGMGRDFASNLGLNYKWVMAAGFSLVSMIAAVTLVIAGVVPFLGLIVPNIVSRMRGDNLRLSMPWVALLGALFVLACDVIARLLRYPYEIPIATVVGVIGSVLFIYLLLNPPRKKGVRA
ncbi:ABC transporter permease [Salinibius halmophilus]|uniref:ABC transporter permease n=1 Tax=Salinibius halmophilus TaxID=1853216 RepID=UPI000E6607D5|nr:iron chelate uptake ABC transporter family permease subunit [Salinibius halmophilus]